MRFVLTMAGLGGFLYGIDFGVIAASMPYIRALGTYTDAQLSAIVGAVLFGGLVSSLTAGVLCDRFGRRRVIIGAAGLFLLAIPVVCLSSGVFAVMMAGRVMQGMSAGYMSVAMPMYLTETLPPDRRGRGTGVFQFCLGLGLVSAALTGLLVAHLYGAADSAVAAAVKEAAWKVNFWWTLAPVAALFIGSFRLKESPVWMENRARGSRVKAQGAGAESESPQTLLQRKYVLPFLLAVLVLTFNKTTGMSSITSYSVVIFQKAGFTGSLGNVGDLAIKFTNLVVTLFAAAIIDRKGRTFLLRIGTAGMTVGLAAIGAVLFAIERCGVAASTATGVFTLAAFFVMQVFYALGPGICVWLVLSELMPRRIRANGMAIALFMNQLTAWGLASTFFPWVNAWGWHSVFFFFAANGVLYFATACFIPETKGKTLAEIEELWSERRH